MMKHCLCAPVIIARLILFILKDCHICKTVENKFKKLKEPNNCNPYAANSLINISNKNLKELM